MSILKELFESLPGFELKLEAYGRRGSVIAEATGQDVYAAALAYRELLPARSQHQRLGLLSVSYTHLTLPTTRYV